MIQFSLRLEDTKIRIGLNKFQKLAMPIALKKIEAGMKTAKDRILGNFPRGAFGGYDIELRAGQKYQRTGNLGRGTWVERAGLTYTLKSDTAYSKYVIGNGFGQGQAWMHAGRWPIAYNQIDATAKSIAQESEKEYQNMIAKEGFNK